MNTLVNSLSSVFSVVSRLSLQNIIEMIVIAFIIYEILLWIKNTHAWVLLRGIIIILVFTLICTIFRFDVILWILGKIATIAVMALVVIFQPELRAVLERLGSRTNFISSIGSLTEKNTDEFNDKTIAELVRASFEMAKTRTGALIVIERQESLREIEKTGIIIEGRVSSQLLINIFEHNTPLHDGAVLIRGNTVVAATCYLPLSDNMDISKALGTRHRAAIGVSEATDAFTIVVSEETGEVSVTEHGEIRKVKNADELKAELEKLKASNDLHKFSFWKGKSKDEGISDEESDS